MHLYSSIKTVSFTLFEISERSQVSFVLQNISKFPQRLACNVALINLPERKSVVQRKEILSQFILLLYPERSQDRPKDGNLVQKIINNSTQCLTKENLH